MKSKGEFNLGFSIDADVNKKTISVVGNSTSESQDKSDEKSVVSTENDDDDRGKWDNQFQFFLSCLGYAVGFGNVWRFPYLCYKNGGAVFLIPYVTMLIIAGLPMFFMELAIGQYSSLGPNLLFANLAPLFTGLGYGMIVVCALTSMYFNVIVAWSFFYTFKSFTDTLPWSHCDNDFNTPNCFSEAESEECRKNSTMPYMYNKTCFSIQDYCSLSNLVSCNDTHCVNDQKLGNAGPIPDCSSYDGTNMTVVHAYSTLPRILPSEEYFQYEMLGVSSDISWENMGDMRWELVGCLALSWVIVGAALAKGIKSSGKVVYFTAIFPYVVLIILLIRGLTLEGFEKGIDFYFLNVNTSKLLEVEVWNDAATQIFYSLGTAFGSLITLASYNKLNNNCMRDAMIVSIFNCATSVFAGFVIFSILGYLATNLGKEVSEVVSSGSGLAFVVYPAAVTYIPVSPLWSILFFLMLITLGLDSQFAMVETITTGIFDKFENLRNHKLAVVGVLCVVLFLCGLTMCLEGGIYMFELMFLYAAGVSVLVLALVEIIVVQYVFGFKNFMELIECEMKISIPKPLYVYWAATWTIIGPASLLVILALSFYYAAPAYWGDYVFPDNIQAVGWLMFGSSVACIPIFAIYQIIRHKGFKRSLLQTTGKFCTEKQRRGMNRCSIPRTDNVVINGISSLTKF